MWTLLIVDDDRCLAESLADLALETMPGSFVHVATTPTDALAILDAVPPGAKLAVLADHDLRAELTGADVLRHAAARHPRATRLLMSGEDPARLARHVGGDGAHHLFRKPFLFTSVVAMLPP